MMIFKFSDLTKVNDASLREALSFLIERYDSFMSCYIDREKDLCLSFWGVLTLDQIKDVVIQFKHDVPFNVITPLEFIDYHHHYDEDAPFTDIYIN